MMSTRWTLLLFILVSGCQAETSPSQVASAPAVAPLANGALCIGQVVDDLAVAWPKNRTINIVAFGHSVPAGYGKTPNVQKTDAYPRLLEDSLAAAYPLAVINVITEGVGGENSTQGLTRFQRDALDHHPRVVMIDYGLNDRSLPLAESERNLTKMIMESRSAGACAILMTPTWDDQASPQRLDDPLRVQADMIKNLGSRLQVPVADSLESFMRFKGERGSLMAQSNHPNRKGHELVAENLAALFAVPPQLRPSR